MKTRLFPLGLALIFTATIAQARLGETEAQSEARYGKPEESKGEGPLMAGAKEVAYHTGLWRIRVAFAEGVAVRLEYFKAGTKPDMKKLEMKEAEEILEAEKGGMVWHANVMGPGGRRAVRNEDNAKSWERSDRAKAHIQGNRVILETKNADEIAEKLAKLAPVKPAVAPGGAGVAPVATPKPKF